MPNTTNQPAFAKGPSAVFGCIMILIGTSIGGGMLALPLSAAEATFPMAVVVLLLSWFAMTVSGLFILEVNFAFKVHHNHFHSMTRATLGKIGQWLSWICCIGLFYTVISAYISGNASLLSHAINLLSGKKIPESINAILFTVVIAIIISLGTRSVDLINRGLMSIKGILLITMITFLLPNINPQQLLHTSGISTSFALKAMTLGAPIFLFGFGYHAVIPSLVNYIGPDKIKMRFIILTGTSVSLIIYLLWIAISFGIIPSIGPHSFQELAAHGKHLDTFLADLQHFAQKPLIHLAITGFSNIAMTTSCLGVSLGLFDFLVDGLNADKNRKKWLASLLLTFTPPLVVTLLIPHFFLIGLKMGSFFVIVLEILIPVAMVYQFRKIKQLQSNYRAPGGIFLLWITALLGVAFFACASAAYF